MNPAFRMFIRKLINEARTTANPSEIFQTPAMRCDPESDLKAVSLVSTKDLEMLMWCLKSLFFFSGSSWDLWILDGGLNNADVQLLREHFPNAHVCAERDLTSDLLAQLASHPQTHKFRLSGFVLAKKIVDAPWLLEGHKFLLLDSDVLFFRNPVELTENLRRSEIDRFAFSADKLHGINSGVAIVPSSRVRFDRIEEVLCSISPTRRAGWQVEQDLYAAISKDCFDELSNSYAIEPVQPSAYDALVCCHFVHVYRHRFYAEGIRQLREGGFLDLLRKSEQVGKRAI
jgi:hypothetical protein